MERINFIKQLEIHYQNETVDIALLPDMVAHIGDSDPKVRDELILEVFYMWFGENAIPPETMKALLKTLCDNEGIRCTNAHRKDAILTRTFSALVICLIFDTHHQKPFLTTQELEDAIDKILMAIEDETVFWGHDDELGWAHAGAHYADLLNSIIELEAITKQHIKRILTAMLSLLTQGSEAYHHEEEERLTHVIHSAMNSGKLTETKVISWLTTIEDYKGNTADMKSYRNRINLKQFVRALYFRMCYTNASSTFLADLQRIEKSLNPMGVKRV